MYALLLTAAIAIQGLKTTKPDEPIVAPPDTLSFHGFYKKCAYFRGLAIIGSEKVDDKAFRILIATFDKMLAKVPDSVMEALVKAGSHYSIIADEEGQTDLPEYTYLKKDPKTDWDKRARGLGGLVTSGGEENICEYPNDRYKGESIFIHEFAHTLSNYAFGKVDPDFKKNWKDTYDKAIAEGLWKNTYSATNKDEYFAEGVQMYFDCARSAPTANGVHNEICNREQLKKYDPRLYDLIDKAYGHNPWRYEGTYATTKTGKSIDHR